MACQQRLMRKPTCDTHGAGSQSPGRKLLTRGGVNFSKVLPPRNSPPSTLFEQEAARRRHLKVARVTGKGGVPFFFIPESDSARAPVRFSLRPLKRNGLGFQQKQLMIKRFHCRAQRAVTITAPRSFERRKLFPAPSACGAAAGTKVLRHLIFKQGRKAESTPEPLTAAEVWLLNPPSPSNSGRRGRGFL